jgi:DNA-binding CsgD family transcriptional regulator
MSMPEAATFADVLDCLGAALYLVDPEARIVHANGSANAMLRRRAVLRATDGKLAACEPGATCLLRRSIAEAGRAPADAPSSANAVALPLRAPDGEHCVAHVLALGSRPQRRSGGGDAVAAVLVHKVALVLSPPPEAIARLYGLTPSEARVLFAVVEVGGVRETAEALGIAEATVKTHLHRLYGKTGAARQADLVKLVAGFANPVVSRSCSPAASAGRCTRRTRTIGLMSAARMARSWLPVDLTPTTAG